MSNLIPSIVELEAPLAKRRSRLDNLRRRKERLVAQIEKTDAQVASLAGRDAFKDIHDLSMLKQMRNKPLKFRKLEDFLREREQGV